MAPRVAPQLGTTRADSASTGTQEAGNDDVVPFFSRFALADDTVLPRYQYHGIFTIGFVLLSIYCQLSVSRPGMKKFGI